MGNLIRINFGYVIKDVMCIAMEQLNKIVRRAAGAVPIGVVVTYVDGREVDCSCGELPEMIGRDGRDGRDVSEIMMMVGDADECYEIMFRIKFADGAYSVVSDIVYHTVDYEQDGYDGRYSGSVGNKRIVRDKVRFMYAYKRTVVIPVKKIARCIEEILG